MHVSNGIKVPPLHEEVKHRTSYSPGPGVDLVFQDVNVNLGEAEILHDVSGVVRRGEMLAVMGPSGAGKSTLLNALAGRLPHTSGHITLNQRPLDKQMRRRICYVMQQDIFFSDLTLRQTLTFTALLRLPDKMKRQEKIQRVDQIVDKLDLRKFLDTVMGGLFMPGLSGGEKKRANIACELLTDPSLLLIDEPTSGLDAAIAYNLMTTLKTYSETSNKTVVTTIHQPSSAIFHMFNRLLLLVDGHVAYFGPGAQILDFFSRVGQTCTPHYNPADFILEKVKESKETADNVIAAAYKQRHTLNWPEELRSGKWPLDEESKKTQESLSNGQVILSMDNHTTGSDNVLYDISYISTDAVTIDMDSSQALPEDDLRRMCDPSRKWPTGFWTQYTTLTHRAFVQSRGRILSKLNLFQTLVLGIIVGLLWFRLPRTELTLNDRLGLLFFTTVYWSFFSLFDAVLTFPTERPVMKKERSSGAYRISAYYLAKMTSELPLVVTQPILFYSVIHWMCNLSSDPAAFVSSLGVVLFTSLTSQSLGLFVGIVIPDARTGMTATSLLILGSMLTGGYYQKNIPAFIDWVRYASFIGHGFRSLVILELDHRAPLECLPANMTALPGCLRESTTNSTLYVSGSAVLEALNMTTPLWVNLVALAGILVIFRYLGYLALRFYDPTGPSRQKSPKKVPKKATSKQVPVQVTNSTHVPVEVTNSEQVPVEVTNSKEVPVEVTNCKQVPVEVTKSKQVPVEVTNSKQVPLEVTNSKQVPVEVTNSKQVPVEVTNSKQVPVEVTNSKQVPVEVTNSKQVPVEVTNSKQVPVEVTNSEQVPVEVTKF